MKKAALNVQNPSQKFLPNAIINIRDCYIAKNGLTKLYITLRFNNKKIRLKTNISINPAFWDEKKQQVKASHPMANDINLIINNCKSRVNDIFVRYRLQFRELTPELLKCEYQNPSVYVNFYAFMLNEINARRGQITESTYKQHLTILSKLKNFKKELFFTEIDEDFIKKLESYLKVTLKNKTNTIRNTLKTLKAYLSIAVKKGIINKNPFEHFKLKNGQANREFLTEQELWSFFDLYKRNYLPENYQRVLRYFLFSCVAGGIRISDIKKIRMEDIINKTLVFSPYKIKNVAPKILKIPLNNVALQLIKDECPHRLYGNIFETLSDQRTNKFLKEIAKVAKVNKNISFHCARHTFATYYLKKNKNIAALQRILGHSNINETMIYAHILMEDIETEMGVFNELFNSSERIQQI